MCNNMSTLDIFFHLNVLETRTISSANVQIYVVHIFQNAVFTQ